MHVIVAATILLNAPLAGEWTRLSKTDGVVVEIKEEGATTWVRGRATLDVDANKLKAALLSLDRFPKWMASLKTWKITKREKERAYVYGRHDLPWPMADRDYVVRYTWIDDGERFMLESRTVKSKGEDKPGVVRLKNVRSTWTVQKDGEKSKVSYTYNGDLGGDIPRWAMESGWKSEAPALFNAIEKDLKTP